MDHLFKSSGLGALEFSDCLDTLVRLGLVLIGTEAEARKTAGLTAEGKTIAEKYAGKRLQAELARIIFARSPLVTQLG